MGLKTPKLFFLGLIRFLAMMLLIIAFSSLIIAYRQDILGLIWSLPENRWLVWLWHLVSWLLSLILMGAAGAVGYLLAQVLFSVIIMETMSQITEKIVCGEVSSPPKRPFFAQLFYLVRQEIPRAVLPLLLLSVLPLISWLTPAGPVVSGVSSCLAAIFLAWDNTDLHSARRMVPFKERWEFLFKTLPFHMGFGMPFLIPVLNVLLLSFAPVGGTLFRIEQESGTQYHPKNPS